LKRSTPLKRSAFKSKAPAQATRRPRKKRYPSAPAQPVRAVMGQISAAVRAVPKNPSVVIPALRDLAKDRECLFRWQRGCTGIDTVACHENRLSANKGSGYKAHDWRSAWGCPVCHREFDQGQYDHDVLDAVFDVAWRRQLIWWLKIAQNLAERARARAAASEALGHGIAWLEEHGDVESARILRDAWRGGEILPVRALSLEDVRCVLRGHVQGRKE
jgi:hypothetical protein